MVLVAHAEFQVLPELLSILKAPSIFAHSSRVLHVDVLVAEDPAECHRYAARSRGRIVGGAEIVAGSGAKAVQRVPGAGSDAGIGFGDILVGVLPSPQE